MTQLQNPCDGIKLAQAAYTLWYYTSNNTHKIGEYHCYVNPNNVSFRGVSANSVMVEKQGHKPFEIKIHKLEYV